MTRCLSFVWSWIGFWIRFRRDWATLLTASFQIKVPALMAQQITPPWQARSLYVRYSLSDTYLELKSLSLRRMGRRRISEISVATTMVKWSTCYREPVRGASCRADKGPQKEADRDNSDVAAKQVQQSAGLCHSSTAIMSSGSRE